MTKSQEIDLLKKFVEKLPSSYLRDVLRPFLPDFERGVYSDIVPSVRDSWDARVEAEKEVKAIKAEIAELEKARDAFRRDFASEVALYRDGLKKLQEASTIVSNACRWASDAINSARA